MTGRRAYPAERGSGGWTPTLPVVVLAALLLVLLLSPALTAPGAVRLSVGPATDQAAADDLPQPVAAAVRRQDAGSRPAPALAGEDERAAALTGLQALLEARTAAVAGQDVTLWSAAGSDPVSAAQEFSALASLPVTRFDAHPVAGTLERLPPLPAAREPGTLTTEPDAPPRWRVRVATTYQLGESLTVRREDSVVLVDTGEGLRLESWEPYPADGAAAPWQLGEVSAATGARASLLAWPTAAEAEVGDLGGATARAVQALGWVQTGSAQVDEVLGRTWPRTTLVLVPGTSEQYNRLVPGEQPAVDDVYAAVTADTATPDGTGDVVVLNPAARDELDDSTWEVTVAHELVHVASGAVHGDGQPLWLSEGLADVVGWSSLVHGPADRDRVAARLLERVRAGQGPDALAGREQFTSDDPDVVGDAYDGSWLAALLLQDRLGQQGLLSVYAAASHGEGTPEERLDAALREQAGLDTSTFERQWLAHLAEVAAAGGGR